MSFTSGNVRLARAAGTQKLWLFVWPGMIAASSAIPCFAQCTRLQKLVADDAADLDHLGSSVSLDGDTAIVGASADRCAAGNSCGAAYVFRFDGTGWDQKQKLAAFDADAGDSFGSHVCLSGDRAIIGSANDHCSAGANCGSAYIFHLNNGVWSYQDKLTASDAGSDNYFGRSVAVNGNTAVVGAPYRDCPGGTDCGAAYVFRFDGANWIEEQKLTWSDTAPDDLFGRSVAILESAIAVGADGDDCPTGGVDCGAVYTFRFDGSSWLEEQKLTPNGLISGDLFGWSVALSKDTLAVGAVLDNCADGISCGSAFVYRFQQSTWALEQTVTASDAMANDLFGGSVSVSGNILVVGAEGVDGPAGDDCGAGYVFRFNGSRWAQVDKLSATDAAINDSFGASVSVSGRMALVGAPSAAGPPDIVCDCGAAYAFRCFDCQSMDADEDGDIDIHDFRIFQECFTGPAE